MISDPNRPVEAIKPANPPAFPVSTTRSGMTMLDHFAGLALQAIITSAGGGIGPWSELSKQAATRNAYDLAAAMLTERGTRL